MSKLMFVKGCQRKIKINSKGVLKHKIMKELI